MNPTNITVPGLGQFFCKFIHYFFAKCKHPCPRMPVRYFSRCRLFPITKVAIVFNDE